MFNGDKPGPGRPKGALNAKTRLMNQWAEDNGQAWIDLMWSIAQDTNERTSDRLTAATVLAKKAFPDLKSIEVSGELDTSNQPNIDMSKVDTKDLEVLKRVLVDRRKDAE